MAGQENAANVSLTELKALPALQERDQSRRRFGDGGGVRGGRGFGDRANARFSGSKGGGRGVGGFSRSGGRFSGGSGGFKGRNGGNKW